MVNPRRIYYYDDDDELIWNADPGDRSFEGYDAGAYRGWHPNKWEGYNEGAYRGGWNDDLQYMSRNERAQDREQQRRHRDDAGRRRDEAGPHTGKGPRNFVRSDARILDDVVYRLTMHGQINASRMRVNVQDGVVLLEGQVDSRQQKRAAGQVADSVSGVQDVDNRLRIAPQGQG